MATSIDTKHQQLVDDFEKLNGKLNLFINGGVNDTILLDSGPIKTLAGINSSLQKFKYIQKVIDYKLYSDMVANDTIIDIGLLVRIWGDATNVNGLYQKTASNVYTKVSYQDLYDLRDFLPNPWNYSQILKDKTQFTSQQNVLTFSLPSTTVTCFDAEIRGKLKVISDVSSNMGSYREDFVIHVISGSTVVSNITYQSVSTVAIDTNFTSLVKPTVIINHTNDGLNNNFTVSVTPLLDSSSNVIPCNLDLQFFGLDTKKFNLL